MIDRARIAEENESKLSWHEVDLAHASAVVTRAGLGAERIIAEITRFSVAAPSWALGSGGTRFAAGAEDGTVRIYDLEKRKLLWKVDRPAPPTRTF